MKNICHKRKHRNEKQKKNVKQRQNVKDIVTNSNNETDGWEAPSLELQLHLSGD